VRRMVKVGSNASPARAVAPGRLVGLQSLKRRKTSLTFVRLVAFKPLI
jgi:hypothetical protein